MTRFLLGALGILALGLALAVLSARTLSAQLSDVRANNAQLNATVTAQAAIASDLTSAAVYWRDINERKEQTLERLAHVEDDETCVSPALDAAFDWLLEHRDDTDG